MNPPEAPQKFRYYKAILSDKVAEYWLEFEGENVYARHANSADPGVISGGSKWKRCHHERCLGEAQKNSRFCLAHESSAYRRDYFFQCVHSIGYLVLQGITISQVLWNEICASDIFSSDGPKIPIELRHVHLDATINFDKKIFKEVFWLSNCILDHRIAITNSQFDGGFLAEKCLLNGIEIRLSRSTFRERVIFSNSTHAEDKEFNRGTIAIDNCTLRQDLVLEETNALILADHTIFDRNILCKKSNAHLGLHGAQLHGALDLSEAECNVAAPRMHATKFLRLSQAKIQYLDLQDAIFDAHIYIDAICEDINLLGAELRKGGTIDVFAKSICLDQIRTGGSFRVIGKQNASGQAEITGLLNADVNHASLTNVNLSRCSFHGVHGLSSFEIDSSVTLPISPLLLGRRKCIADEFAWRKSKGKHYLFGWDIKGVHVGLTLPRPTKMPYQKQVLIPPRTAAQVAVIYRDIRRSFESRSDMSGAADFYYGEMEMRRHSARFFEKEILTFYKYMSGYGIKPFNTLLGWLTAIAAAATLIETNSLLGIKSTFLEAVIFSIRAATPGIPTLFKEPAPLLITIETILRIWGPLSIAMFILAIRNRLMRKPSE